MKTLYVEFIGRPGAGKSTTAFHLFSKLKKAGFRAEFVNEYAKELVYKGHTKELQNQLAVTAEHNYREDVLNGVVNVVVTDSSLLLGNIYNEMLSPEVMEAVIKDVRRDKTYLTVFLTNRTGEYQEYGRTQSREEAEAVVDVVSDLLKNHPHIMHDKADDIDVLFNVVLKHLAELNNG